MKKASRFLPNPEKALVGFLTYLLRQAHIHELHCQVVHKRWVYAAVHPVPNLGELPGNILDDLF